MHFYFKYTAAAKENTAKKTHEWFIIVMDVEVYMVYKVVFGSQVISHQW